MHERESRKILGLCLEKGQATLFCLFLRQKGVGERADITLLA